jgi:hypothetical protein
MSTIYGDAIGDREPLIVAALSEQFRDVTVVVRGEYGLVLRVRPGPSASSSASAMPAIASAPSDRAESLDDCSTIILTFDEKQQLPDWPPESVTSSMTSKPMPTQAAIAYAAQLSQPGSRASTSFNSRRAVASQLISSLISSGTAAPPASAGKAAADSTAGGAPQLSIQSSPSSSSSASSGAASSGAAAAKKKNQGVQAQPTAQTTAPSSSSAAAATKSVVPHKRPGAAGTAADTGTAMAAKKSNVSVESPSLLAASEAIQLDPSTIAVEASIADCRLRVARRMAAVCKAEPPTIRFLAPIYTGSAESQPLTFYRVISRMAEAARAPLDLCTGGATSCIDAKCQLTVSLNIPESLMALRAEAAAASAQPEKASTPEQLLVQLSIGPKPREFHPQIRLARTSNGQQLQFLPETMPTLTGAAAKYFRALPSYDDVAKAIRLADADRIAKGKPAPVTVSPEMLMEAMKGSYLRQRRASSAWSPHASVTFLRDIKLPMNSGTLRIVLPPPMLLIDELPQPEPEVLMMPQLDHVLSVPGVDGYSPLTKSQASALEAEWMSTDVVPNPARHLPEEVLIMSCDGSMLLCGLRTPLMEGRTLGQLLSEEKARVAAGTSTQFRLVKNGLLARLTYALIRTALNFQATCHNEDGFSVDDIIVPDDEGRGLLIRSSKVHLPYDFRDEIKKASMATPESLRREIPSLRTCLFMAGAVLMHVIMLTPLWDLFPSPLEHARADHDLDPVLPSEVPRIYESILRPMLRSRPWRRDPATILAGVFAKSSEYEKFCKDMPPLYMVMPPINGSSTMTHTFVVCADADRGMIPPELAGARVVKSIQTAFGVIRNSPEKVVWRIRLMGGVHTAPMALDSRAVSICGYYGALWTNSVSGAIVTARNCALAFHNVRFVATSNYFGVVDAIGGKLWVSQCTFASSAFVQVAFYGHRITAEFDDCDFTESQSHGIRFSGESDILMRHCCIKDSRGCGILAAEGTRLEMQCCDLRGNSTGAHLSGMSTGLLWNCMVTKNDAYGLQVDVGSKVNLSRVDVNGSHCGILNFGEVLLNATVVRGNGVGIENMGILARVAQSRSDIKENTISHVQP